MRCPFHLFCVKFASQETTMSGLLMISEDLWIKIAACTLDLGSEFGPLRNREGSSTSNIGLHVHCPNPPQDCEHKSSRRGLKPYPQEVLGSRERRVKRLAEEKEMRMGYLQHSSLDRCLWYFG